MRFHLRVDSASGPHVRSTLFVEGANCGSLTMRALEWVEFVTALREGCSMTANKFEIEKESEDGSESPREGH